MSSETYQLAILLSLKDGASGGLDRFGNRLREMGKEGKAFHESFEKIRADLNRDLALGGIGLAGLTLLKKGVDEAGNYEEKLLDLRQAYRENEKFSQYSAAQQEDQIKRIMALATDLGNRLQGSTARIKKRLKFICRLLNFNLEFHFVFEFIFLSLSK